jgi:hypothetical protein
MKRHILDISFCLFCNFYCSKPTRTRTQNREKQRNGLIVENHSAEIDRHELYFSVFVFTNLIFTQSLYAAVGLRIFDYYVEPMVKIY